MSGKIDDAGVERCLVRSGARERGFAFLLPPCTGAHMVQVNILVDGAYSDGTAAVRDVR